MLFRPEHDLENRFVTHQWTRCPMLMICRIGRVYPLGRWVPAEQGVSDYYGQQIS